MSQVAHFAQASLSNDESPWAICGLSVNNKTVIENLTTLATLEKSKSDLMKRDQLWLKYFKQTNVTTLEPFHELAKLTRAA